MVLLLPTFAACSFDISGIASQVDVDVRSADAASNESGREASMGDAGESDAPAQCGWPFRPAHVDPCGDALAPGASLDLADVAYVYDTNDATFSPADRGVVSPPSNIVDGVRTIWIEGLSVRDTASLRVVGSMPLMIVSTGPITVSGAIDVSSFHAGAGAFSVGAGASVDRMACSSPPQAGVDCDKHGASGGGGGGFSKFGSGGDSGGVTHNCDDGDDDGKPPTAGGAAVTGIPARIRAGCAGAPGASTTESGASPEDKGEGGPGGGAIQLVSRSTLVVDGVIHAGGAGGTPGSAHRASGGGGGSGGYIGLEANDLQVATTATLAANGGGGGGGCDDTTGSPGEDGRPSIGVAAGGAAQGDGGRGNDGGYLAVAAQAPDATIKRGGGGGGGGGGFVLLYVRNKINVDSGANLSPAATQIR